MEENVFIVIGEKTYNLDRENEFYVYDGILDRNSINDVGYVEIHHNEDFDSIMNPSFYIYRVTDGKTYFILKDNSEKIEQEKKQADQILIDYVANYVAPEELVVQIPMAFDEWRPDTQYSFDQKVRYDGNLYKCLTAHTSQTDWTPTAAPSLWARIGDPTVEYPEWFQPTGAHDAYSKGDKVSYKGKKWVSDADGNVWEPGQYGWTEVTE